MGAVIVLLLMAFANEINPLLVWPLFRQRGWQCARPWAPVGGRGVPSLAERQS
jgi:hypothetical protein